MKSSSVLLFLVLVLALLLRFWGIARESVWFDEAVSVQVARLPLDRMIEESARDTHPPLYLLGLKAWAGVLGFGERSIRGYSTAWSLIGLIALFVLARSMAGRRTGLIVLLLGALNPMDIYYAQEARSYSQWAALATASTAFLWLWMATPSFSRRSAAFACAYLLLALAVLFSQPVGVVFLLAQGIWASLIFMNRRQWKHLAAYMLIGIACLAVEAIWFHYVFRFRDTIYSASIAWMQRPPFSDLFLFLIRDFFWGRATLTAPAKFAAGLTSAAIMAAFVLPVLRMFRGNSTDRTRGIAFLLWMLFAPVCIAVLASWLYHPIYHRLRFCLIVLPYFLILIAWTAGSIHKVWRRWMLFGAAAGAMFAGTILQYLSIEKPDHRAFARYFDAHPAKFVAFSPEHFSVVAQYYGLGASVLSSRRIMAGSIPGDLICYCIASGSTADPLFDTLEETHSFSCPKLEAHYYRR